MLFFYIILLFVLLFRNVLGVNTRYYELNITSIRYNADCSDHQSSVLMINNQLPGTPIYLYKGEQVTIIVRNNILPNLPVHGGAGMDATIHFHGIRQIKSVQSDGVPFLTQKPISPGDYFTYTFDVPDQVGTFFYHAHVGLQEMSVFGPVIIYESEQADPTMAKGDSLLQDGPFKYDDERIISISEWWHMDRGQFEAYYLGKNFTLIKEAQSFLINGQGIYSTQMDLDANCKGFNIVPVDPFKTYRIRVIGAMTFRTVGFAIANHKLLVIEVDGDFVKPYYVDYLEVSPGQRFSVLIVTDQHKYDEFGIAVIRKWAAGLPPMTNGNAILKYNRPSNHSTTAANISGITTHGKTLSAAAAGSNPVVILSAPMLQPDFPLNDTIHWYWNDLQPYYHVDPIALGASHRTIKLRGSQIVSNNLTRWYINDISFVEKHDQVILHDILDRIRPLPSTKNIDNTTGYDHTLGTYPLFHSEVIDIVIQTTHGAGEPCRSHPWHTHGHSHWEIAYGSGEYTEERDGLTRNVPYPIYKDLTLVYPGESEKKFLTPNQTEIGCGWSKIRIIADNPGVWAMHCHNSPHMYMGMMIALEESPHLIVASSRDNSGG